MNGDPSEGSGLWPNSNWPCTEGGNNLTVPAEAFYALFPLTVLVAERRGVGFGRVTRGVPG